MSTLESAEPSAQDPPRVKHRFWLPLSAVAFGAVVLAVIWNLPPDFYDRGMRMTFTYLVALAMIFAVVGWFLFFSGFGRGLRGAGALLVAALVVGLVVSIRGVEFSGDMVPTFDWRWTPSREALLEAHRAAQAKATDIGKDREIPADASDFPEYRGRRRDGVVDGPPLARSWNEIGPDKVWRQPVGGGYAAFAISGDMAVTIEQRRDREAIVAYRVSTGREEWVHDYPALFSETLGGDGPRATPTIHEGRIYSLGATGELVCLEPASGSRIWSRNILADNESGNIQWGMCGSPLVYDGMVVVNPGSQNGNERSATLVAYDATTGEPRWRSGHTQASYSSPMLAELAGRKQILIFDAAGLAGYDAADGRALWSLEWKSDFDINAAQPVVIEVNRLFLSSAAGCAVVEVGQQEGEGSSVVAPSPAEPDSASQTRDAGTWTVATAWRNRSMKCSYANPVVYDGNAYGLDEGILVCVNLQSGKRMWKKGRHGHGQLLLCDDLLVILSETGQLVLVEATPDEYRELGAIQAIEGKTWNNPAMVAGRILIRNHLEMACYDLPLSNGSTASVAPISSILGTHHAGPVTTHP